MALETHADHPPTTEPFITAVDVAAILAVKPDWVYDQAKLWERTNRMRGLPSYKIGGNRRFRWTEIEAALMTAREQP